MNFGLSLFAGDLLSSMTVKLQFEIDEKNKEVFKSKMQINQTDVHQKLIGKIRY